MKVTRTNIETKLKNYRDKHISEQSLLDAVEEILSQDALHEEKIIETLESNDDNNGRNTFKFDALKSENIYHIEQIKEICFTYRLRFLNSRLFREDLPLEAIQKIKRLEKEHQTELSGFKIMAPAKAFQLKNADDPLLFAPIGNDYYYLIHKWGKDLHPLRKWLMWPFRSMENILISILAIGFLVGAMFPDNMFSKNNSFSEYLILSLFTAKWIAGLVIFYGFKRGKNFSTAIWDSEYFNA